MADLPKDFFVQLLRFTRSFHQDVYPAIDPARPELSLAGKVAIVTGASKGIGARGYAASFARAGVKGLVLLATKLDNLKDVEAKVKEINPKVELILSAAKLSDQKEVEDLFVEIKGKFGHADILVNNAAFLSQSPNLHETDLESWWKHHEINTKGPLLLTSAFIRALPDPKSTPATIINMNTQSFEAFEGMSAYTTSKLALLHLTRYVADMYPNVTAVSLAPGLVDTDTLQPFFRQFDLETAELSGGVGTWLASDPERSKFLSGRWMVASWDVDELVRRKEEIVGEGLLKLKMAGRFGKDQFEE